MTKYPTTMPLNSHVPKLQLTGSEAVHVHTIKDALYFKTTFVKRIRIGSLCYPRSPRHDEKVFAQYSLCDELSRCIGHITISSAERNAIGHKMIDMITVCWAKGYVGPPIDKRYRPARKEKRAILLCERDAEPQDYPVFHVMLVKWAGNVDDASHNVVERVALGTIVQPAWKKLAGKSQWIVLG